MCWIRNYKKWIRATVWEQPKDVAQRLLLLHELAYHEDIQRLAEDEDSE